MRQLLNLDERACGEELGGVAEWEAIIRIYYMENLFPIKEKKTCFKATRKQNKNNKTLQLSTF